MLRVRFVLRREDWLKVELALTEARLVEVHLFDVKMQRHKLFSFTAFSSFIQTSKCNDIHSFIVPS